MINGHWVTPLRRLQIGQLSLQPPTAAHKSAWGTWRNKGRKECRRNSEIGHSVCFSSAVWQQKQSLLTSARQSSLIRHSSPAPCVMLNGWITGIIFARAFHPSLQGGELSLGAERGSWDDNNEGLLLSLRVIQCLHDSWRIGLRSAEKIPSGQGQGQIVRFDPRRCWKVLRGIVWAQSTCQTESLCSLCLAELWSLVTLCNC